MVKAMLRLIDKGIFSLEEILMAGLTYEGLGDIVDICSENGLNISETELIEIADWLA
tara:strand:- start:489 stop:659 length:171 start_codon:yes stop_codon:yes gene_type:complete